MHSFYIKSYAAICILANSLAIADSPLERLTEAQATEIVEEQITLKQRAEAERKRRLLQEDSNRESFIRYGAKMTQLRRVEPRTLEVAKPSHADLQDDEASVSFVESISDYQQENISIGATVFDDTYTQIMWREPEVSGAKPITVWTNVNFKYMRPISHFQDGEVDYSYFGFTTEVDTDAYFVHPETGEKVYRISLPDWMPKADDFPDGEASYLVLVENDEAEIPDQLYRQMDALLRYFVENESELVVMHQRSEALRKAKAEYLKKNPQPEKDIVINYWPIQSNSDF